MLHRVALLLAAVLFLALPLRAAEITDFTLENGLEVVVLEDRRAPFVVNMVWYKVGAADEPPGMSGIAHYLEHLMFKGTDDLEPGEFSRVVAANGGTDNAFTSYDYTGYFQRVASDRLEIMIGMEADRMQNLQLGDRDIATERQVVLEERAQRTDSDPGALFAEQRSAAQYLNHPYGRPIIGWRSEIEALTLEDALSFYETYYAPNNAVLVVAGDVSADEVRALAENHFGPIPRSENLPPRSRPPEPPQLAERRLIMEDERVAQPYVVRSYLAPSRNSGDPREAAALTLLAEILGGLPQTSVLGRQLQFEEQTALHTSAFYRGVSYDETTFGLLIVPARGVSLEEAEAALDRKVEAFLDAGEVDEAQLERIRTSLRASRIYEEDDVGSLARRYGAALTSGLSIEDVRAWPDLLQSVTAEEIIAAGRRVLDRRQAVTGWLRAPADDAGTAPSLVPDVSNEEVIQ